MSALKHRPDHVASSLDERRQGMLYRSLRYGSVAGPHIVVDGHTMINLGSNDYLGVPGDIVGGPRNSSSRLVAGNDDSYRTLEDMLAEHRSTESALVYPTGYMAVLGAITTFGAKGCTILSDQYNHASIIDASRLSGAHVEVFRHNDMDDLASKMSKICGDVLVITEGIFSMDGDYSNIREIADIASRHGASIVLDDAHGDFAVGPGGGGTARLFGVDNDVYATISSLSKALGSFGGYVAADVDATDLQINLSRQFIYTSALPPAIIQDAICRASQDLEERRHTLHHNTRMMANRLQNMGFGPKSPTHIMPIIIGGERQAVEFSNVLAQNGVFAPAIRYPTVPRGRARIRVSVTASLGRTDIDTVLAAFEEGRRHVLS